jgi:dTDP-4-dehydrorhamnose reductase
MAAVSGSLARKMKYDFPFNNSSSLILGANGQLGSALQKILPRAIALSRFDADLSEEISLKNALDKFKPNVIFNAAAYTAVDKAESDFDMALQVNCAAPERIAEYCKLNGAILLHYSTDYVFAGSGNNFWQETDSCNPCNAYGLSKLRGEEAIKNTAAKALIFRTSWVFDSNHNNFFKTMLRLFAEREKISVVADQIGAPTFVDHLAFSSVSALLRALQYDEFPSGIYHLAAQNTCSWHEFAEAILLGAKARGLKIVTEKIDKISSSEYKTAAARPLNSRLDCAKALRILDAVLPSWQNGLESCFRAYDENRKNLSA